MPQAIAMMNADQLQEYMKRHRPDEYVLLDVRQEWEYEESHIPGARLMSLVELPDRLGEIPRDKPIITQCRTGGRSMAAAALLEGYGFENITNFVGGMLAWEGHVAIGPMELGLIEFTGQETPEEVVLKAYAMECSLQSFYLLRADMAETPERVGIFMELAGFEDRHMETLLNLYEKLTGEKPNAAFFAARAETMVQGSSEGGVDIQEFVEEFGDAFDDDLGILEVAAAVEAQAMDYYLRCALQAENPDAEATLQLLAREERAHLRLIGRQLDAGA